MLMLLRKQGDKIYIGDGITITVSRIGASNVTLGIEAPRDVPVRRAETVIHTNHIHTPEVRPYD